MCSPRVSGVSAHLRAQALTALCSRLSFQGYLSGQQPWRIEIVLSSGAEGKFVCCPVKRRKVYLEGQALLAARQKEARPAAMP